MINHLQNIQAGLVSKSNVIGIRKAINADNRRSRGYSVGCTAPKISSRDLNAILDALATVKPRVDASLHESGFKIA